MRRGGRLDLDIRLDMPTENDRYLILKSHLNKVGVSEISLEDLKEISKAASGFVSSDLAQIVRNSHITMIQSRKE